ncbi:TPA: hypothetical protein RMT47_005224 [Escherichia coli]|nr:hypothetical protein [Escherichia coli]HDX9309643.1 hypothetical protein [Escherichia coli]
MDSGLQTCGKFVAVAQNAALDLAYQSREVTCPHVGRAHAVGLCRCLKALKATDLSGLENVLNVHRFS